MHWKQTSIQVFEETHPQAQVTAPAPPQMTEQKEEAPETTETPPVSNFFI